MVIRRCPASAFIFILLLNFCRGSAVWELNRSNFDKFLKTAEFPIFFVDSPTCTRCRVLYPFFFAASQIFTNDREIFFGRVLDNKLVREWDIDTLPVILYFEKGEKEPERLEGDITVDNIIDTISNALPGHIGDFRVKFVIEVNANNYHELVITPKQNALLLMYDDEHESVRTEFETVARAFRFDEQVIFCALDSKKYKELKKSKFGYQDVPSVFWYEAGDKENKYRYGATLHSEILVDFVNERTNLWRTMQGDLLPTSGRIEKLDAIYVDRIPDIKDVDIITTQSAVASMKNVDLKHPWEKDFAEYYVELLERMMEVGNSKIVLKREENEIQEALSMDNDLTQKQRDFIRRKRNIVRFMIKTLEEYIPSRTVVHIRQKESTLFNLKEEL